MQFHHQLPCFRLLSTKMAGFVVRTHFNQTCYTKRRATCKLITLADSRGYLSSCMIILNIGGCLLGGPKKLASSSVTASLLRLKSVQQ